jgi:tetratricopeptide (TPR) repeat protein
MKSAFIATLLFAFLFLFSPCLSAQRPTSSGAHGGTNAEINVQVRNPDGTAAPRGIHLRLEAQEGGSFADCVTETGGKCRFLPGSGGMYIVRISQLGFQEVSVDVNLVDALRAYVNIDLKPDPGAALPDPHNAAPGNSVSALDLSVPENARLEFEKGQRALQENKLDASISHFRKAIKLYQSFPQAYTLAGTAYLEEKNWKEAEKALLKATSLDPKSSEAYLALGAVLNQTREYPRAETALLRGLELKPEAPGGHYELARTYWELGRWREAAPHARKAVSLMPDVASPHALLGNILLRERNAQGALHEYQEYLRLDANGSMAPGVRQMVEKLQKATNSF